LALKGSRVSWAASMFPPTISTIEIGWIVSLFLFRITSISYTQWRSFFQNVHLVRLTNMLVFMLVLEILVFMLVFYTI
jgi:hypothetical protein